MTIAAPVNKRALERNVMALCRVGVGERRVWVGGWVALVVVVESMKQALLAMSNEQQRQGKTDPLCVPVPPSNAPSTGRLVPRPLRSTSRGHVLARYLL